jgi:hypothetical protein
MPGPSLRVNYKDERYPNKKEGPGHYKGEKVNDRKMVNGKECVIAHGVTTRTSSQVKKRLRLPSRLRLSLMSHRQATLPTNGDNGPQW